MKQRGFTHVRTPTTHKIIVFTHHTFFNSQTHTSTVEPQFTFGTPQHEPNTGSFTHTKLFHIGFFGSGIIASFSFSSPTPTTPTTPTTSTTSTAPSTSSSSRCRRAFQRPRRFGIVLFPLVFFHRRTHGQFVPHLFPPSMRARQFPGAVIIFRAIPGTFCFDNGGTTFKIFVAFVHGDFKQLLFFRQPVRLSKGGTGQCLGHVGSTVFDLPHWRQFRLRGGEQRTVMGIFWCTVIVVVFDSVGRRKSRRVGRIGRVGRVGRTTGRRQGRYAHQIFQRSHVHFAPRKLYLNGV